MKGSAKEEFIELMAEDCKSNGFSELTSKIVGILYLEPDEISLEELSRRTGYSLSAISTEIKFIERVGMIKRSKKPRSRKVFFYMEKDMLKMSMQYMRKKYELMLKTKSVIPSIIEDYKLQKSKDLKEKKELEIIKNYYNQILLFEGMFKNLMITLEKQKK